MVPARTSQEGKILIVSYWLLVCYLVSFYYYTPVLTGNTEGFSGVTAFSVVEHDPSLFVGVASQHLALRRNFGREIDKLQVGRSVAVIAPDLQEYLVNKKIGRQVAQIGTREMDSLDRSTRRS
jgi:hypothetical protein